MKYQELNNKSRADLQSMLKEFQSKLMQLRFDLAEKKVKDLSQFKKTRVAIARVMTALKANQ